MADISAIYDRLRESPMNSWVGGGDPALVGAICLDILSRHIPIEANGRLLDFGCGIGRVIPALLQHRPELKGVTGIDIVPDVIRFCEAQIAPGLPQASFELLAENNDHYERFKDGTPASSRAQLMQAYGGAFDAAYAFSVFTHIDAADFVSLLRFVGALLKPAGSLLFTAFILTPYSRSMLADGPIASQFPNGLFLENGDIFIGNSADKLAFIAYDIRKLEQMVFEAGLIPTAIEYGGWRGSGMTRSLQDVVVCRKQLE